MSEIEKLYRNAGFKKQYCGWLDMGDLDTQYEYIRCNTLDEWKETAMMSRTSYSAEEGEEWDKPSIEYPPFTADKQLELIKLLLKNYEGIDISKKINRFNFLVDNATFIGCHHNDKSFEESLAGVINKLWVDMPEEERKQVKGILE